MYEVSSKNRLFSNEGIQPTKTIPWPFLILHDIKNYLFHKSKNTTYQIIKKNISLLEYNYQKPGGDNTNNNSNSYSTKRKN